MLPTKRTMLNTFTLLLGMCLLVGCGSQQVVSQPPPLPQDQAPASSGSGSVGTTLLTYRGHTDVVTALAW